MTITDAFNEKYFLTDLEQVVVLVPERHIGSDALLLEGQWMASGKKDWMIRVDPADPRIPLQRHVHIARAKHTTAKTQQVSWNQDLTRHDRGSFNDKVGGLKVVQDLARAALKLPDTAVLEHVELSPPTLNESTQAPGLSTVYLKMLSQ